MKITIEGADEAFAEKLVALAAQQGAELAISTVRTGWTVDRAEQYLSDLPTNALRFACLVVDAEGDKAAEELREEFHGELRGPTIALSRAVPRGERRKWWPSGTEAPITPRYDPEHPSWQKAIAYTMTSENVTVFRAALARLGFDPAPADHSRNEGGHGQEGQQP
ncbi:hypothetical protein [Streptomyces albovinaceus]|uniref:hypothetical protein n=1 Tax=Streptomyces albovinaceus TaxID=66867 RepID=UPI001FC9A9F2|nr:hypothetical protein [Streptomyces albovinaceus]